MTDSPLFDFTPVPVRARRDGWTPERQRRFIALLRDGLGSAAAARQVGKTKQTAYALRERPDGTSFRAAWDDAVARARRAKWEAEIPDHAWERAIHGILEPIIYRGREVGRVRRYDNRTLRKILRHHYRERRRAGLRGGSSR